MILILEDNPDRIERFTLALQRIGAVPELRLWRTATAMLQEIATVLPQARLISLDHDLVADETGTDPGDGTAVVRWLVTQEPTCPILVHTANSERAAWMRDQLTDAQWEHHRVPPLGDDWIEEDWRRLVRRILKRPSAQRLPFPPS